MAVVVLLADVTMVPVVLLFVVVLIVVAPLLSNAHAKHLRVTHAVAVC